MLRQLQGIALAAVFLAVAVALGVFARESASSFQQCRQAQYSAANAANEKPKYLPLIVEEYISPYCTARFIEDHNAVITAIATVLLTFVTGGLVWMGYQQIRTTRFQLRAYVFPDSAALVDGTMLNPPLPNRANEPGVVLLWKNFGQTPATNVVSWGQLAVIEPVNEHTLVVPSLQTVFATSLGTGGTGSKSLWFGRALTPNEIADVQAGVRGIYIYGRIEYRDIFRKHRWTNFRLIYTGPFPPPQGVVFNHCQKGNDAH